MSWGWKSHNEEETRTSRGAPLPLKEFSIISLKEKKKPTTSCSIWWLAPEQSRRYFQTHSSLAFPSPWGPAIIPGLLKPGGCSLHLTEQIFKQSLLAAAGTEQPSQAAGLPVGGSRAEFISHILDTSLSHHPPSLPSPFIPKSYSHDRNKLARGTGHTLESSKRSVGNR